MADKASGKKRPAEEAAAAVPDAKKRAADARERDLKIRKYKRDTLAALLEEDRWGSLKAVLEKAVNEEALPHLVYLLYAELTDLVDDAVLEHLISYMHTDKVVQLCASLPLQPSRRVDFVQSMLMAVKSIASRPMRNPAMQGLAQTLNARTGCLRLELNILSRAALRSNEAHSHLLKHDTEPGDESLTDLYTVIRKEHNIALPDAGELAADLQTLQTLAGRLVHDKPAGAKPAFNDSLKAYMVDIDQIVPRVLRSVNEVSATATSGALSGDDQQEAVYGKCFALPRLWAGEWTVATLGLPAARLVALMLVDTVLGSLVHHCLDELYKRNPSGTDAVLEGFVTKLQRLRRDCLRAVDAIGGDFPTGPAAPGFHDSLQPASKTPPAVKLSDALRSDFFREAVWVTWKRGGASGRVFDGVQGAAEDVKARSQTDARGRKSVLAPAAERVNRVSLPNPAVQRPPFSFEMKGVKPGTLEWTTYVPIPRGFPSELYGDNTAPPAPPAPKPGKLPTLLSFKYENKAAHVWSATRLLTAAHMEETLVDDTYYLTDIDKVDTVASALRKKS
eukprot:TRINITY_DN32582_c0_g1_i1.p1 TRINITY_DN32582_c0_g1~~TRINITY_DN32582_c0_g1_i1.p1  ORF type:complete len:595 (+),score=212.98 TRINITY_DN32582_c0_g1_i1:101-1786(+)